MESGVSDATLSRVPQVVPVLDVKGGIAVHAVGGRRACYERVRSVLGPSADPLELAREIRAAYGLDSIYCADLDAIAGEKPRFDLFEALVADGFEIEIDAGLRDVAGVGVDALERFPPTARLVAALETLASPRALAAMVARRDGIVFGLDLFKGKPRAATPSAWPPSAVEIARLAIDCGVRSILVLDVARVGGRGGPGLIELCDEIRALDASIELETGGGARGPDDLEAYARARVSRILVGTALHDGSWPRREGR